MYSQKEKEFEKKQTIQYQEYQLSKLPKLDINKIERLSLKVLEENFRDFSKCEEKWEDFNDIKDLKSIFARLRRINEEIRPNKYYVYYEEEVFMNNLLLGKVVEDMFFAYRLKTNYDKCPLCGANIIGGAALSRRDNQTNICSDCGTKEALEDIMSSRE